MERSASGPTKPDAPDCKDLHHDTQKWIDQLWKRKEDRLEALQVSEHDFDQWYKKGEYDVKFTRDLRVKIKEFMKKHANVAVASVAQGDGGHPAKNAVPPPVSSTSTVSTGMQCRACRGGHSKHTCGKQTGSQNKEKDTAQQMRSVHPPPPQGNVRPALVAPGIRILESGVANPGLQRQPAVQERVSVPGPVYPLQAFMQRVADLEQTVKSLTNELQLVKSQKKELSESNVALLESNATLLRLAASSISLNGVLLPDLKITHELSAFGQEETRPAKKPKLS
jgi:hypothetical protein